MAKAKLTKGELKRERDSLARYKRYLPTLLLKKQQLQMEILRQHKIIEGKINEATVKENQIEIWAGLLGDSSVNLMPYLKPKEIIKGARNVAGVDLPIFNRTDFDKAQYDLFSTPLWMDAAIDKLREFISLREEIKVLEEAVNVLRGELRVTTQRVNLFEKVKIPESEEAIRLIKIYLGDQQTNAVGRSKIAKKKIEAILEKSA